MKAESQVPPRESGIVVPVPRRSIARDTTAPLEHCIDKLVANGGHNASVAKRKVGHERDGVTRMWVQVDGVNQDHRRLLAGFPEPFRCYTPSSGAVFGERLFLVVRGFVGLAVRHMPTRPSASAYVTLIAVPEDPGSVRGFLLDELHTLVAQDVAISLRELESNDFASILGIVARLVASQISEQDREPILAAISAGLHAKQMAATA